MLSVVDAEQWIEHALVGLSGDATPEDRLAVAWKWYESHTDTTLGRPPSNPERHAVRMAMQRGNVGTVLLPKRVIAPRLAPFLASKAHVVAQATCATCDNFEDANGESLGIDLIVDVNPWSAQSNKKANKIIKAAVREELAKKSYLQPWTASRICLRITSLVPPYGWRSKVKDADNLVKGILDALHGAIFENDRQIQCLTSRRIEYAGLEGYYMIRARSVYPWDADVVDPSDATRLRNLSGERIKPQG